MHFSLIQAADLILVDHHGQILDESGPLRLLNTAAFMIHSAIHAARPDVLCAAHSHSIHGRAFSTLGRELDIITQDSCAFYNVSTSHGVGESGIDGCLRRIMSCIRSSGALSSMRKRASTSPKL